MRKIALLLVLLLVLLLASASGHAQTTSGATSAVNISNPASADSKNRLITPPTVVAPGLAAAGMEICLGSSSGCVSMMGAGLTFGRTTPDDGCSIRLAARQLFAFGFQKAALALMCQDPRVAGAMAAVGQPCPVASVGSGARLGQKFAGDITGSIDRPRIKVFAPWRNPDDVVVQVSAEEATEKGLSAEEERWFTRHNAN
jgi:hypothetical protein